MRLDWKGDEPPCTCSRAHSACFEVEVGTLFSYRFFAGKHTNLLELESLISLLRRVTREGIRAKRLLVLVDSRVVLESRLKRTIELTKNEFLASKTGVWVSRL